LRRRIAEGIFPDEPVSLMVMRRPGSANLLRVRARPFTSSHCQRRGDSFIIRIIKRVCSDVVCGSGRTFSRAAFGVVEMVAYITVRDRKVPVYSDELNKKEKLNLLKQAIEIKLVNGRRAIKQCLENLISVEIVGSEAILHSMNERDSIALSLY